MKYLIKGSMLWILLAVPTLYATSQTSDTGRTTLPNAYLRKAIKLVETGKVCQEELALMRENFMVMQERLVGKDSTIAAYRSSQALYEENIASSKAIIASKDVTIGLKDDMIKKHRRNTVIAIIGGAILVSLAIIIK